MTDRTRGNERILIVGGGIMGLGLATGLRRLGLAPTIVEQAPRFGAVGAGISLSVNAMAALRSLGLADAARQAGRVMPTAEILTSSGRCLSRVDLGKLAAEFGPTLGIHRAQLHEVLLSGCEGLDLRAGTTVEKLVDHGEVVEANFSDGTQGEFDRVIGADGLRSRTREQVFGETALLYSGYTCWRLVVDRPEGLDGGQEMWGRGQRFGLMPLPEGRVYCFATDNAPEGTPDPADGRVERFRARFADFAGHAPAVLEQIERPEQLIHNDLYELPPHPWHAGRVLLLGDAAHATTPNMGQGAAMALEDASVLCEMLAGGAPWDAVLPAFVARREPRVRFVVDQSRRIGRMGQTANPLLAWLRNTIVGVTPDRVAERTARRAAATAI